MSIQSQPSLRRVLSDTTRIISSNSLHFSTLSLLLIFPIPLFNIIHTLLQHPSPSPFNSQYGQLPSFNKSQLLYFLLVLIFNLFSISSVTHSTFHAFHKTPLKISSSLKSILSSFLPLLATKLAYFVTIVAISMAFGICTALILMALMALGFEIGPTSKPVIAVALAMAVLLLALLVYLGVQWSLMDPIVVVESKCGFAPFKRSAGLVKGARRVAFFVILAFGVMQGVLAAVLGGGAGGISGGVVVRLVVYAAVSSVVLLFGVAAKTVLFVHCREFNGELELQSDVNKLGQVYVQLPLNVVDVV